MIPKPIAQVTFADVDALVLAQRPEARELEYKRDLVGGADADRREFLADVSSLANGGGGDLIFGIIEDGGLPVAISGVTPSDPDKEILRLESMALTGLQPRVIGIRTVWLPSPATAATGVILMRVPGSFAAPHRIVFGNSNRFYTRHSRGKMEMDVHELRDAFLASDGLSSRLRKFHGSFVEAVERDALPVSISLRVPRAILAVVPLNIMRETARLPIDFDNSIKMLPRGGNFNYLKGLDGFTVHDYGEDPERADTVTLSYWRGYSATTFVCGREREGASRIWVMPLEKLVSDFVSRSISALSKLGVSGPWAIFFSLRDVGGYRLIFGDEYSSKPIRAGKLDLPEEIVEEEVPEAAIVRILTLLWLAFGEDRPPSLPVGGR